MENEIKESLREPLAKENISLVDVRLGEEDNVKTLFVTIDADYQVDSNLCVKAMNIVSPIIDSLDLDLSEYILDVGSKGVDNK